MTSLVLAGDDPPLCEAGAIALAQSGRLVGVDHLELTGQWIGWRGLQAILAVLDLPSLLHLSLADCGLESEGAELLAETVSLTRLRVLDVAFDYFSAPAVGILVRAPQWGCLEQLNLSLNGVDVAVADSIAVQSALRRLRKLALNDCRGVDDTFIECLSRATVLGDLESLQVGWNQITNRGAHALASSNHLPRLREIFIGGTLIEADGVAALRARGFAVEVE